MDIEKKMMKYFAEKSFSVHNRTHSDTLKKFFLQNIYFFSHP